MQVAAIILAAGASRRFESDKMFATVDGRPLLLKSLENYINFGDTISALIIACRSGLEDEVRELVEKYFPDNKKPTYYVTGGLSRSESVLNCLDTIEDLKIECDTIAISDAARCYTSLPLIEKLFASCSDKGNAVPAIRRAETFKIIENGVIKKSLKNDSLYEIQTPQVYKKDMLIEAYRKGLVRKRWAVDDSAIYFSYYKGKEKINIVNSEVENIKITFPHDIKV